MAEEKYLPYYKLDGGPAPVAVAWEDIVTVAHSGISWESLSIEKIDFSDPVDMGLATLYGIKWDEQQIKRVAKSGTPYTKIQDAINSIGDNSATKQYVIEIGDGIFTEEITMKPYVHLKGKGYEHTIIDASTVTNGLINFGTACNNSLIQCADLTFRLAESSKHYFKSAAVGLTLTILNSKFYNNRSASLATQSNTVWQGTSGGACNITFNGCFYDGTHTILNALGGFIKILILSEPNSDRIWIKNSFLFSAMLTEVGSIHVNSTTKVYLENVHAEIGMAGVNNQAFIRANCELNVIGCRIGKANSDNQMFIVQANGILNINSSKLQGFTSGSTTSIVVDSAGTTNIYNSEVDGGLDAIRCTAGTMTLNSSSFNRSTAAGSGYDINNTGGTVNVTFCKYTNSNGTITKVNESVDKVDGFHANATPTASQILPLDSSGNLVNSAGLIEVSKADPLVRVTDTGDNDYAEFYRTDTNDEAGIRGEVQVVDSTIQVLNAIKIEASATSLAKGKVTVGHDTTSEIDTVGKQVRDIVMNSKKLTGLAAGASAGDSVRY
ncbi:MAG: hypothetical protein QME51_06225, partial [Planctomycetota bacterium]|nr:hypothetical protein [Planctomycetota bacterium]